jgi:ABC-type taurine transport system substrate-binding protein
MKGLTATIIAAAAFAPLAAHAQSATDVVVMRRTIAPPARSAPAVPQGITCGTMTASRWEGGYEPGKSYSTHGSVSYVVASGIHTPEEAKQACEGYIRTTLGG